MILFASINLQELVNSFRFTSFVMLDIYGQFHFSFYTIIEFVTFVDSFLQYRKAMNTYSGERRVMITQKTKRSKIKMSPTSYLRILFYLIQILIFGYFILYRTVTFVLAKLMA